jgi:hypothetical protein
VRTVSLKSEAASRSIGMLRTAMGPTITGWLEDPAIVEIMLNSDGRLWIDRLRGGLSDAGKRLSAEDAERVMHLVAHHVGAETPARELVHAPFERGLASGANGNKTSIQRIGRDFLRACRGTGIQQRRCSSTRWRG